MPKVSKMTINFELLNASKMSSLRFYISSIMEKLETLNLSSRVNLIQQILFGTLLQKELMSLSYIHISLYL